MEPLSKILFRNAMIILASERRTFQRVNDVYVRLQKLEVKASGADFLSNPFISTALSILEALSSNYKIKQAIKLLNEAGQEALKESSSKKRH